jgi:hypothetical protein
MAFQRSLLRIFAGIKPGPPAWSLNASSLLRVFFHTQNTNESLYLMRR